MSPLKSAAMIDNATSASSATWYSTVWPRPVIFHVSSSASLPESSIREAQSLLSDIAENSEKVVVQNQEIQNQMNEKEKMKKADFVIYNDDKKLLIPQVLKLHEKFISI